jgi:periplasmic protein TonB
VRSEGVRWALCAALAAAAHGCAFVALSMPKADLESDAGSPIVTLELSPILAAPAPPPDEAQAVAPPDAESAPPPVPAADPTPPVAQAPPTPELSPEPAPRVALAEPSPLPTPTPLREPAPQAASKPDPAPLAVMPTSNAALALPPPPPEKGPPTMVDAQPPPTALPPENDAPTAGAMPPPPTLPPPEKKTPTALEAPPPAPPPPPSAPSVEAAATVDAPSAPVLSVGREDAVFSAALQSWRRDLIAQIERHKRFPAGAAGQSGVARVAFSIDRSGRVTEVRIAASSALDEAALDLIWRSQPFPAPPPALPESDLSFVAPVRYLPPAASR